MLSLCVALFRTRTCYATDHMTDDHNNAMMLIEIPRRRNWLCPRACVCSILVLLFFLLLNLGSVYNLLVFKLIMAICYIYTIDFCGTYIHTYSPPCKGGKHSYCVGHRPTDRREITEEVNFIYTSSHLLRWSICLSMTCLWLL